MILPQADTPRLTDRPTLERRRARALTARDPAFFLQEDAILELQERLSEVNRTFTRPAIVTGFPKLWQKHFPHATIVADTEVLALEEGAHDLVIHAFALHWADDPVGQLIQARRALAPDGLFLGVMFGGTALHELRAVLAETEVAVLGGLSPRVAPMAEIRDLGGLLQRAGFALPVADNAVRDIHYRDLFHLIKDLREMGETNVLASRLRRPLPRRFWVDAQERYARAFPAPDGRICATAETIFLTGWAPAPNQQKPLRPGSAAHRLADALAVEEVALGDRPATTGEGS